MKPTKPLPHPQSELKWIDDNVHRYESSQHAEAVKRNILTRCRLQTMLQKLNQVLN